MQMHCLQVRQAMRLVDCKPYNCFLCNCLHVQVGGGKDCQHAGLQEAQADRRKTELGSSFEKAKPTCTEIRPVPRAPAPANVATTLAADLHLGAGCCGDSGCACGSAEQFQQRRVACGEQRRTHLWESRRLPLAPASAAQSPRGRRSPAGVDRSAAAEASAEQVPDWSASRFSPGQQWAGNVVRPTTWQHKQPQQ